jgi:hypothetical protein
MKVKTNELSGAQLDWAVAKCEGVAVAYDRMNGWWETSDPRYAEPNDPEVFSPSTDWAQGGLIIEREKLGVWWATHYVDADGVEYGNHWYCETGCTDDNYDSQHVAEGATPLVAAMRCYVASKLGDKVECKEEEDDDRC